MAPGRAGARQHSARVLRSGAGAASRPRCRMVQRSWVGWVRGCEQTEGKDEEVGDAG